MWLHPLRSVVNSIFKRLYKISCILNTILEILFTTGIFKIFLTSANPHQTATTAAGMRWFWVWLVFESARSYLAVSASGKFLTGTLVLEAGKVQPFIVLAKQAGNEVPIT